MAEDLNHVRVSIPVDIAVLHELFRLPGDMRIVDVKAFDLKSNTFTLLVDCQAHHLRPLTLKAHYSSQGSEIRFDGLG